MNIIKQALERYGDYTEAREAIYMIASVIENPIIDDMEMLQRENKEMANALLKLGYTNEQISDICNGAI